MHKIKIETEGTMARILIDGTEVRGVTSYSIEHRSGDLPVLHLRVLGEMTIDSDVLAPLPHPWSAFEREKIPPDGEIDTRV